MGHYGRMGAPDEGTSTSRAIRKTNAIFSAQHVFFENYERTQSSIHPKQRLGMRRGCQAFLHACGRRSRHSLYRCWMNFSSSETSMEQCFQPSVASVISTDDKRKLAWLLHIADLCHLFLENNVQIRISVSTERPIEELYVPNTSSLPDPTEACSGCRYLSFFV